MRSFLPRVIMMEEVYFLSSGTPIPRHMLCNSSSVMPSCPSLAYLSKVFLTPAWSVPHCLAFLQKPILSLSRHMSIYLSSDELNSLSFSVNINADVIISSNAESCSTSALSSSKQFFHSSQVTTPSFSLSNRDMNSSRASCSVLRLFLTSSLCLTF